MKTTFGFKHIIRIDRQLKHRHRLNKAILNVIDMKRGN